MDNGADQSAASARPKVCGAWAHLPPALVEAAIALETSAENPAGVEYVERHLWCPLQEHGSNGHHGLVLELDGVDTGSVWTTWGYAETPAELSVMPDCPGVDEQGCSGYAGHSGAHTYELDDPQVGAIHRISSAGHQPDMQTVSNGAVRLSS